jgi:hypothetical protein
MSPIERRIPTPSRRRRVVALSRFAYDNQISCKQKAKFMRLMPEVRPMLLRGCQLTLLTSLTFGTVLAVFSTPLNAQATQDLPKTIPNLSGYDGETRHTIEIACVAEKINGPVAYGACLTRQIASLQKK